MEGNRSVLVAVSSADAAGEDDTKQTSTIESEMSEPSSSYPRRSGTVTGCAVPPHIPWVSTNESSPSLDMRAIIDPGRQSTSHDDSVD